MSISLTGACLDKVSKYLDIEPTDESIVKVEKFFVGTFSKVALVALGLLETLFYTALVVADTPLYYLDPKKYSVLTNHAKDAAYFSHEAFKKVFSPHKKIEVLSNSLTASKSITQRLKACLPSSHTITPFATGFASGAVTGIVATAFTAMAIASKQVNWTFWGVAGLTFGGLLTYTKANSEQLEPMSFGLVVMSLLTCIPWNYVSGASNNVHFSTLTSFVLLGVARVFAQTLGIFETKNYQDLFMGALLGLAGSSFVDPLPMMVGGVIPWVISRIPFGLNKTKDWVNQKPEPEMVTVLVNAEDKDGRAYQMKKKIPKKTITENQSVYSALF